MRVSVVIATRNRPAALRRCLEALAGSFPADAETIVVVDGADPVPDLEPFVEPLRLVVHRTAHGGPAAARNAGLALATGDVVAFTDDDCRPSTRWVQTLADGVSTSSPRAVGGTTVNGLPRNPYADAAQVIIDLVATHDRARSGAECFFTTNNLAFPADALRDLGGFDESLRAAEDRDVCRRWRRAGYALERVPEAVVEHDAALGFATFARQCFRYGIGAARFHASRTASRDELVGALGFHARLPVTAASTVGGRGLVGGARLAGLLGVWEVANLAGFCAGTLRRVTTAVTTPGAERA